MNRKTLMALIYGGVISLIIMASLLLMYFPMFATSSVKGKKANSFYQNLAMITGKSPDWNFTKYLISKDGEVLKPFSKNIEPDSEEIISAIESLL